MDHLEPKQFSCIRTLDGLSERAQQEHYRLYAGYVEKYNQLQRRLMALREEPAGHQTGEMHSLKVDLTYALSAIRNHELFFDILGRERDSQATPTGPLADALRRDFGGFEPYLADLRRTAAAGGGWAWTTVDLEHGFLFNYGGTRQHALPVWDVRPIVAIDLYVHAFTYDFHTKGAYIDVVLAHLNWERIGERYLRASRQIGL